MATAGRKSSYESIVKARLPKIEKWIEEGYTDAEIYKKLGISHNTFYNYVKKYDELSEVLKKRRDVNPDVKNEAMLNYIKNLQGYYVEEETTEYMFVKDDKGGMIEIPVKKIKTKKWIKGGDSMYIFAMKNTNGWTDRQQVEVTTEGVNELRDLVNSIEDKKTEQQVAEL